MQWPFEKFVREMYKAPGECVHRGKRQTKPNKQTLYLAPDLSSNIKLVIYICFFSPKGSFD